MAVQIGAGIQVAGAWVWMPQYLQDLDGFVFKARSHLDFAKAKFGDGLKAALEGRANASTLGMWQLPIPLLEVITRQNAYFKAIPPAPLPT
jgi:hypothetical protein